MQKQAQQQPKQAKPAQNSSQASAKQQPGKRKTNQEQAHETRNETAAGRKNKRNSSRSKQTNRKTAAKPTQNNKQASATEAKSKRILYTKINPPCGAKTTYSNETPTPPPRAKQPATAIYIPKKCALRGPKHEFKPNASHRARRAKHPATHILYAEKFPPCGAKTLVFQCSAWRRPPDAPRNQTGTLSDAPALEKQNAHTT